LSIPIGLGIVFGLAGCRGDSGRPPLGKVTGKVTLNGQPVTSGSVIFTPIAGQGGNTGQPAIGQIEPDGSYTLTTFNTGDGAILGQHAVTVETRDMSKFTPPTKGQRIKYELPKSLTPRKYADPQTTPFRFTVEPGSNTINLDMKD
jgi:hypothetical protein